MSVTLCSVVVRGVLSVSGGLTGSRKQSPGSLGHSFPFSFLSHFITSVSFSLASSCQSGVLDSVFPSGGGCQEWGSSISGQGRHCPAHRTCKL